MNLRFRFLSLASLLTVSTFAADAPKLPAIAAEPTAKIEFRFRLGGALKGIP
ncbi:MAG: hypothetical protein ACYC67_09740 [Prosthecobacter sp.]